MHHTPSRLSRDEALLLFEAFNGDLNRMSEAIGIPPATIRRVMIDHWFDLQTHLPASAG